MTLDVPMKSRSIKCYRNRKMQIPLYFAGGVVCFVLLLLLVSSINFVSNNDNAWALIRGTPYDDLLTSDMSDDNNNDNQTNEMAVTEATGAEQRLDGTNAEFMYGDYGNDEIQGSVGSDHLSGGPGSDVIYGYGGGDFIEGGSGVDSLYGGEGNDALSGGEGADYFDCGPGMDSIDDFNLPEGDFATNNCEVLEND